MGLFSFIKDAGAKLFGGKTSAEKAAEEAEEKATEHLEAIAAKKEKDEAAIKETINDLELHVENLHVSLEGETAIISGKAHDQATKEKVVLLVGNTHGIAMVDDRMDVEHKEPEAKFHTVVKGDTLGKIAKEHYGNAMKYPVIFEANKPMLKDPDLIYPGQVLRIPVLD